MLKKRHINGILIPQDNQEAQVYITCPMCGKQYVVRVHYPSLMRWVEGKAHIQDALPLLSGDDLEALISGTCADCWERMFGDD